MIDLLAFKETLNALERKAIFLIVDGLHNISGIYGESELFWILTQFGDLAQLGFILVCGTSTISGPIDKLLLGSRRRRISLPCSPLKPPTMNEQPVFKIESTVQKVLVDDCGGHGRALELLIDVFPTVPADIGPEVKSLVAQKLEILYRGALPEESDGIAIIKAVLANRRLKRHGHIPGTQVTPDEVCQNGLLRFESDRPGHERAGGYFKIPYIWLLALCITYQGNQFFEELQLLDYRDFSSKENPTMPGGLSWSDFEKLMIKIRKIKSRVFDDGERVAMKDVHKGAMMHSDTEHVCFINRHLDDDIAMHRIETKTTSSNECTWKVATECSRRVNLRTHRYIVQNAAGAPAGDSVLSLDGFPPRTESQQYKKVQKGRLNFNEERAKAAGVNDVFVLFCTSSIRSLCNDGKYVVPPGCILVVEENWEKYFGPYAGRSYLFAREVVRKRKFDKLD